MGARLKRFAALFTALVLTLGIAPLCSAAKTTQSLELARWDFSFAQNIDNWYHWEANYNGSQVSIGRSNGTLRAAMDFSKDGESSSAQVALGFWHEGFKVPRANRIVIDLLFEKEKLDNSITIQATSGVGIDSSAVLSARDGRDAGDGLARASVVIDFYTLPGSAEMKDLTLHFFGNRTTYSGNLYIDTLSIWSTSGLDERWDTALDSAYVNASFLPSDNSARSLRGDSLITWSPLGGSESTELSDTIRLVDPNADTATRNTYRYLEALGKSGSVIFGQQENTWTKAGTQTLSYGDTMDLVGSYAGIVGIDTQNLTSNYSVAQHNNRFGTKYGETVENRITACAELCNWSMKQGSIITLSTHMPNFTKVTSGKQDVSYCGYDFTPGTFYDMENSPAQAILPGGEYNQAYNTYLGMIATFAKQVDGPILFRPLPENPGDWLWWGTAGCDASTYKELYRYTVERLRDVYRVHNMLYVYSPSGDIQSEEEYTARYPGDAYVDILGFGLYHKDGSEGDGWMDKLKRTLEIVDGFAAEHEKLTAVTEIGLASTQPSDGSASAALPLKGSAYRDWYMDVLDIVSESRASYLMTGKNSFRDGFQVPFVASLNGDGTACGHELMDEFIRFFNDSRTIFACHQKNILTTEFPKVQVLAAEELGGIVNTVIDSATVRRLAQSAKEGRTVLLQPAKGAGFHPSGSKLTIKASDLALLAETGASVKIDGPIAGISITNEGARSLSSMGEKISFTAQRTEDTVEVLVCADDTRLTYVPGGLDTEVYMEATSSTTVRLVTSKTPFPYGDPMEMLLGAAATSWSESGKYIAVFDMQNGKTEKWSISDPKGKVLMSGSGLEGDAIQIDGGKTLNWSLNGSDMNWSIAENGRTVLTGIAQTSISDQKTKDLFLNEESAPMKDGRYTLSVEVKDGKVVSWSSRTDGAVLSGAELSATPQINPGELSCRVNSSGTAVSLRLNGSAKLKFANTH